MGMLVTLSLISTNIYASTNAPPERGFSYIELWMVGMQLPICVALVEYSLILGLKKYWKKNDNDEDPKIFMNREHSKEFKKNQDDTMFRNMDKIFFVLSFAYFMVFCLCYWILLN